MAAYRRVYDSHHLQADCQEPRSAPEPYTRQSSMGYPYLFTPTFHRYVRNVLTFVVYLSTLPAVHSLYNVRMSVRMSVPSIHRIGDVRLV